MSENICRFIPKQIGESEINILNFVCETKEQEKAKIRYDTAYKMHLVTKGCGKLFVKNTEYDLNCGDMFFTFPSMEYSLQSVKNFEYMYISFVGVRTNKLMDRLKISKENFLFKNQEKIMPIWEQSIADNKNVLSLRCEGILLYSFSVLSEQEQVYSGECCALTLKIKNYIEEHFMEDDISLETVSTAFSYNKKYISTAFKADFHIGIAQYISTLRIQYACTLMEYGFSSVGDIARRCGFSEPQYFSRVFKNKMGVSPKEHISQIKGKQKC